MALSTRMKLLAAIVAVAFTISGCQSSGKWATAWKERTKPKTEFKNPDDAEPQITYWPYKSVKNKAKLGPVPGQLQEKMAQRSAQKKHDSELNELISEGDLLRKNNQMQDARLVYEKALAISPDNADIHRRLAIVADMQGRFPVADEHYQATLRLRPRDVDVISDKGYSYLLRGNAQQAEMVLREALLIDPSHKRAMANLAAIYAQQNRYPEALAMFRAGGTESEAQQNIAKFFPQGPNVALVSGTQDPAHSQVSPALGSALAENPPNLSKLSLDQIKAEMARRRQLGEQKRFESDQRELEQSRKSAAAAAAEAFDADQGVAQQPGSMQRGTTRDNGPTGAMTIGPRGRENLAQMSQPGADAFRNQSLALQPGLDGSPQEMGGLGNTPANQRFQPQGNSVASMPKRETEIFRGPVPAPQNVQHADWQFQRGGNPQATGRGANQIQQTNDLNSRQMATALGMSAGPGMLFPAPQPRGNAGIPGSGFDNRFGPDFSQPSANQNAQNWSGNSDDQRRGTNDALMDEGLSTNPPSPASNWGSPSMTTGPNWQNGLSESSDWSNDFQSGNARSNGFDQTGVQPAWGQNDSRRSASSFDNPSQGLTSPSRNRRGNDVSRPYNGAWPNSNSLQAPQNQVAPDNSTRFDLMDQFGGGPINGGGAANFGNQNGVSGNGPGNSLPQWPSAPNR